MFPFPRSPFTGALWYTVHPAAGTFLGLATYLLALRPRRRPPEGLEAAVQLGVEACGAFANLPRVTQFNEMEGRNVSDAYWQSKDAKQQLSAFVPDSYRQNAEFWYSPAEAQPDSIFHDGAARRPRMPSTASLLAARLAWTGAVLVEAGCAGRIDFDTGAIYDTWAASVAGQIRDWGIPNDVSARVERVWRFIVAAGRLPLAGRDDDLLDAFEAAVMAGAEDVAVQLVKP